MLFSHVEILPGVSILENLSVECASQRDGLGVWNGVAGHKHRTKGGCVVYKTCVKLHPYIAYDE